MERKSVHKHITIWDDQEDWIEEHSMNLSKFVKKCIDYKMMEMVAGE